MDLESLRLFVDLAETRSFSKTATRSYLSQSAVSQRIRALEREWGHVLVERGKGRPGAQFTEAGEMLYGGAKEILARSDSLKRELAELAGAVGGSLRVATVYSIGLHALTPALSAYLTEYPQVNLHLEYLRTDRIYEALQSGAIDCGIVAIPRERPQVEIVPLGSENMVCIAAPRHALAQGESHTIAPLELSHLPFIAFDPDIPTRRLIDDFLAERNVSVSVVQAFDNIETIKRMVEIGLGVAIVPEPTVARETRDGTLRAFSFDDAVLSRPTGVLLKKNRTRSRALARFLDVLARPQAPNAL